MQVYEKLCKNEKKVNACCIHFAVKCASGIAVGRVLHKIEAQLHDFANFVRIRNPPVFESIHDGQVLDVLEQKPFGAQRRGRGAKKFFQCSLIQIYVCVAYWV